MGAEERVYLDWNATAPPLPEALEAALRAGRAAWANPSSVHADGRLARRHVEDARARVAELCGADPRDVVLTSGGTEANNLALRSAFAAGHGILLTSRLEHPSVLRVAEALSLEGRATLRLLRVLPEGRVDLEDLEAALSSPGASLLALQAVNHETGVIQPVAEAIALCHVRGVKVHVDAVQAYGRVPTDFLFGADTQALAAHKLRGPKGIGALIGKPGVALSPVLLGGAQERGLRPGTVDPAAAAGFAVAASHARTGPERYVRLASLRDGLEQAILGLYPSVRRVGSAPRAPHVSSLVFPGWNGPELVAALDLEGISVSSGSACSAGTSEPSAVIEALLGRDSARGAIRISMGELTTGAEITRAEEAFRRVLARSPVA